MGEAGLNEDSRLQQAAADNHIAGDAPWINLNDLNRFVSAGSKLFVSIKQLVRPAELLYFRLEK